MDSVERDKRGVGWKPRNETILYPRNDIIRTLFVNAYRPQMILTSLYYLLGRTIMYITDLAKRQSNLQP